MILDAQSIPQDAVLEADLCVVGAGAAGITIAREFASAKFKVILLESGGRDLEEETQELYAGPSEGMPFPDITVSRLRYFGGTTNHWGGWCAPLDAIDFEDRPGVPGGQWPFSRATLDPFYERARKIVQIGPYDFDPAHWGIAQERTPDPFKGPHFVCAMLQNSPPTKFGEVYAGELQRSGAVATYLHANALGFDADFAGRTVERLRLGTLSGRRFAVKARRYVLATGGIENARLLLASGPEGGNGLGNEHDLVGRFFMAHILFSGGDIAVSDPYTDFWFYTNTEANGRLYEPFNQKFVSYIRLSDATLRSHRLANVKLMWQTDYAPVYKTVTALRHLVHGGNGSTILGDLQTIARDLGGAGGYLARKALSRQAVPVLGLRIRCSFEQQPNRESRIRLGEERDALGMRRVAVDWRLTEADHENAVATLDLLATELGRTGFGRMRPAMTRGGPWPDDMYGDEHHMGATRMHLDPRQGVVDANCRVHGLANLYVAGSSVFPSGGGVNPTMTITALALRLADHLKEELR